MWLGIFTSSVAPIIQTNRQNGDDTPLFYSSLGLMTLQRAFGLFPRIMGKGDAAKVGHTSTDTRHSAESQRLAGLLQRHRSSGDPLYSDLQTSEAVDGLIIVDRSVDWVTPMCTQLTYQGMIDEYIGIKNGTSYTAKVCADSRPR